MGFFSRLLGKDESVAARVSAQAAPPPSGGGGALEGYRYLLQTAPPDAIEQAHAQAFEELTPEHRRELLSGLALASPAHERAAISATPTEDARALARVTSRAELRQPGVLERALAASRSGEPGRGTELLSRFAAAFVGSAVAQSYLSGLESQAAARHAPSEPEREPADVEAANFTGDLNVADGNGFDGGDLES